MLLSRNDERYIHYSTMYILRKHLSRDKTRSTGRLSYLLCHPLHYPFLRLPQGDRPVYSTAENWAVAAKKIGPSSPWLQALPRYAEVFAWAVPPHLTCQTGRAPLQTRIAPAGRECTIHQAIPPAKSLPR